MPSIQKIILSGHYITQDIPPGVPIRSSDLDSVTENMKNGEIINVADDTNLWIGPLSIGDKSIDNLKIECSQLYQRAENWFSQNYLVVNQSKNIVIFRASLGASTSEEIPSKI